MALLLDHYGCFSDFSFSNEEIIVEDGSMATDEMSNLDPTSSPFKAKYPDNFPSASPNTQARRVAKIVEQNHPEAVIRAAIKVFKNHGHSDAAEALKLIQADPVDLKDAQCFLNKIHKEKGRIPSIISPARALNHVCDIGLSKDQYTKTAALGNPDSFDQKIWPPYCQLGNERDKLRPPIVVTEYDVVVPLNSLVEKTLQRLLEDPDLKMQIERLFNLNDNEPLKISFIFKYGLDGSKVK